MTVATRMGFRVGPFGACLAMLFAAGCGTSGGSDAGGPDACASGQGCVADLPDAGSEDAVVGQDVPPAPDLGGEPIPDAVDAVDVADLPGSPDLLDVPPSLDLSGVTFLATSARNVVIRWDSLPGSAVAIQRSGPGSEPFVEVARRDGAAGRFLDLGLKPEATYRYRVAACAGESCGAQVSSGDVATPESGFPDPQVRVNLHADSTDVILYGLLGGLPALTGSMPLDAEMAMVQRDGTVLWELSRPDDEVKWEVERGPGNTLLTIAGTKLEHLDLDGTVLSVFDRAPLHHDVDLISGLRFLAVMYDPFTTDDGIAVAGETIGIGSLATGDLEWTWRLRDHLALPDAATLLGKPETLTYGHDWAHLNAVYLDEANDKIYANFLDFGQWWRIDVATGEVDWRMGRNGDFGDGVYGKVHEPQLLDPNTVLVMENVVAGPPVHSEAKRIRFDATSRTAEVEWSYSDQPWFVTPHGGAAIRQPDGDVLITDSAGRRILEVTPDAAKKWELYLGDNQMVYKAIPLPRSILTEW